MESPALGLSLLGLFAIAALILTNAYFVATEFALVAVRRTQIELWVEEGRRGASAAAAAIDKLDDAIAATQLGITLASIGLGFLGEPALARLIAPLLDATPLASNLAVHAIAWALAFSIITFLHVVVGELAPKALAVVAAGTCATYGGIHAMQGNPTGSMGLADYLGWDWKSKAGIPIVNVPGCPVQPDNFMETLLYLLYQAAGLAPMIPLDEQLRPTWLFGKTVHEGCDRAGYYEQGDFATEYGSPKCIVKLGCWGPVVKCNVPKRGWVNGVGGCPNVGGICIGCTMPGFPDKFMPFMDEPPGSKVSTRGSRMYGAAIRSLRKITAKTVDEEPKWRTPGKQLLTGYKGEWR